MLSVDHLIFSLAAAIVGVIGIVAFRRSVAWKYGFLATRRFSTDGVSWSPRRMPMTVCGAEFAAGLKIGVSATGLVFLPHTFLKGYGIFLPFVELNQTWSWSQSPIEITIRWRDYNLVLHHEAKTFVLAELDRLERRSTSTPSPSATSAIGGTRCRINSASVGWPHPSGVSINN